MDLLEDEKKEPECENQYINLLRKKRNIRDELYEDYLSLTKEFETRKEKSDNIKNKREIELLKLILKEE